MLWVCHAVSTVGEASGSDLEQDPTELRFRLDSVPAGAWVTFMVCAAVFAYIVGWDHTREVETSVLLAVMVISGVSGIFLPWEKIIRSRYRETVFTSWSMLTIGLIIGLAAVSGGGDSVFVTLLVIPVVFTGLSYPFGYVATIGAVNVVSYVALALASDTRGDFVLMFATALTSTALISVWQARNHERRRDLLAIASRTDPLTGALNRRGFDQAASAMIAGVSRLGHPASLVMLDLDKFKQFNDAHGHAAGDELLHWAVERIRESLRPTDSVARLGGDEFGVLLAGADRPAAQAAARRITEDLSARMAVSVGVASAPADGGDIDTLYRRADAELYAAKRERSGRGAAH